MSRGRIASATAWTSISSSHSSPRTASAARLSSRGGLARGGEPRSGTGLHSLVVEVQAVVDSRVLACGDGVRERRQPVLDAAVAEGEVGAGVAPGKELAALAPGGLHLDELEAMTRVAE